ncbi:MAG: MBL fold metallo-hydrolase [Actinobacteria bacterium]|nr:MBL fold metallo-hydrolase [Actinomycetota bacterium]
MDVTLTVLGSSGGYSGAGKACSSYLLKNGEQSLVLDLGPGALSNLLKYLEPDGVGAVALSHMHFDHYADLYSLLTARRFWHCELPPLRVIAPSDMFDKLACLISRENRQKLKDLMEIMEWGDDVAVPGFRIRALRAKHPGESWMLRVSAGDRILCYSGDTEPCENLIDLAKGADLLICDSTFTSDRERKLEGHMLSSQAAQAAEEAGARRLLLTHIWPTLRESVAIEDAQAVYSSHVDVAREHMKIRLQ